MIDQHKIEYNLNGYNGLACSLLDYDENNGIFNSEVSEEIKFLINKSKEVPSMLVIGYGGFLPVKSTSFQTS